MTSQQKWITLVPIAASMAACAAAPTPEPTTVAFDARSHEIGLPVSVGGRPLTLLLDAAVDPSVIDASEASALGLKQTGEGGEVEGVGNEAAMAFPSSVPEIIIGGVDYGPVEVLVADLGKLRERYGAPMHGILGYSLIKDNAVLIDYQSETVTIWRGAAPAAPRNCNSSYRVPLQFLANDDRLILLPDLMIDGHEVSAFLDTGSSNGLRIDVDAESIAPIRSRLPEGVESKSVGARGVASQRRATLEHPVRLGPLEVERVEVALVKRAPLAVGVGNRFFEALGARLLIDIPGRQVGVFTQCQ